MTIIDLIDEKKQPFHFTFKDYQFIGVYDKIEIPQQEIAKAKELICDKIIESPDDFAIIDYEHNELIQFEKTNKKNKTINENLLSQEIEQFILQTCTTFATSIVLSKLLTAKYNLGNCKEIIPVYWQQFAGNLLVISRVISPCNPVARMDISNLVNSYLPRAFKEIEKREKIGRPVLVKPLDLETFKNSFVSFPIAQTVINIIFDLIIDDLNTTFKRPHSVQRTLQIPNPNDVIIDAAESSFPDIQDKKTQEAIKKALTTPIKKIEAESRITSYYEDLLIYIISELAYNFGQFDVLHIYLKPRKYASKRIEVIKRVDGKTLLSAGVNTIQKKFKLTNTEKRWLFYGKGDKKPAIAKLSEKKFKFINEYRVLSNIRLIEASREKIEDKDTNVELELWHVFVSSVFTPTIKGYYTDNLDKMRHLKSISNQKAWECVFTLKNLLMTLTKPINYRYSTLIAKAGISTVGRHQSKAKELLKSCLEKLAQAGYISGFEEISENNIRIYPATEDNTPKKK